MKRTAMFEDLNENMISLLTPLFEVFSCQPGSIIFQQGDQAEYLYLVLDGKVDMSFKPYDGNPMTISHIDKGGLFGWSAVVGSNTYTSTALAIEDVKAFRIHGSDLREFCREHPEAGKDILERLADGVSSRWKDAHKQVQSILLQGMNEKLKFD
jgi:CRP/FNR family transcriptional regulator, cyclic AMP receptor protein